MYLFRIMSQCKLKSDKTKIKLYLFYKDKSTLFTHILKIY